MRIQGGGGSASKQSDLLNILLIAIWGAASMISGNMLEIEQRSRNSLISGARLLSQNINVDERGRLVAFEQFDNLPFALQRVFIIRVDTPDTVRGGHANSCDELITVLNGATTVALDNGTEAIRVRLVSDNVSLWVRSGIVIRLEEFMPNTTLLVCASAPYHETLRFSRPQADLLNPECMT